MGPGAPAAHPDPFLQIQTRLLPVSLPSCLQHSSIENEFWCGHAFPAVSVWINRSVSCFKGLIKIMFWNIGQWKDIGYNLCMGCKISSSLQVPGVCRGSQGHPQVWGDDATAGQVCMDLTSVYYTICHHAWCMYYWKERAESKIKQNRQWQNRTATYWAVNIIKANMNQILALSLTCFSLQFHTSAVF